MNNRMISDDPSKIRLMRASRIARSTGMPASPRPRSESAVSYPRPPRICSVSSTIRQPISVFHIFAMAASSRMSLFPRSASATVSSATASIAKVFAAINASFCAIASCLPIGWPHCTRSFAHVRATCRKREPAGVEGGERELQSLPFAPENVLARHANVREANDTVLDRLEAHEPAAMCDLHARCIGFDDERGDLLPRLSMHDGIGRPRHDDEQLGARTVRAPELLAVDRPVLAILARRRAGAQVGGIGPGVHFRESEG